MFLNGKLSEETEWSRLGQEDDGLTLEQDEWKPSLVHSEKSKDYFQRPLGADRLYQKTSGTRIRAGTSTGEQTLGAGAGFGNHLMTRF